MPQWLYTYEDNPNSANGTLLHFNEGDRVQLATAEQVRTYPGRVQDWYDEFVPKELWGTITFISKKEEPRENFDGYYKLACFEGKGRHSFYDQDLALIAGPPKPLSQAGTLPSI